MIEKHTEVLICKEQNDSTALVVVDAVKHKHVEPVEAAHGHLKVQNEGGDDLRASEQT